MYRILILLLLLINLPVSAQLKVKFSGAAAIPLGYTDDAVSLGYGGSLNFSYPIFYENFEITVTTTYYYFGEKENLPDYEFSFKSVPLLLGVRFNFVTYDVIPYIGIEGGIFFSEYLLKVDYGLFGRSEVKTTANHWGMAAETGLRININPHFDIDVNAKYHRIHTIYIDRNYLAIQTGFVLRI